MPTGEESQGIWVEMPTGAEAQELRGEVPTEAEAQEAWRERSIGVESQELGEIPRGAETQGVSDEMSTQQGAQGLKREVPTRAEVQGLRKGISNRAEVQGSRGKKSDKTESQGQRAVKCECQGLKEKMPVEINPRDLKGKTLGDEASMAPPPNFLMKGTEAGRTVSGTQRCSSGDRNSTEKGKKQNNKKKGQKPKAEDAFKGLSIYFPKEQWSEMGEWEKIRYKNMKQNYEFMIQLGLPTPKPTFMYYARQSSKSEENESSESDEEWTPTPLDMRREPRDLILPHHISILSFHFLVCEHCLIFFIDECSVHGSPVFIRDSRAEIGVEKRATCTLPPGLRIGLSGIPKAGLGVWNEGETLPAGIHFGPYEGKITEEEEAANTGYSWLISKGRNCCIYIDGKDETYSNWMRYVNCARNEEEQNLVAFQYHGKIYYRACKTILLHSELLVWYGEEYGKELGITWKSRRKSLTVHRQNSYLMQKQDGACHQCPCCEMAFNCKDYFSRHMKRKHSVYGIQGEKLQKGVGLTSLLKITSHASCNDTRIMQSCVNTIKDKEKHFFEDTTREAEHRNLLACHTAKLSLFTTDETTLGQLSEQAKQM
ncbi:hypothetical protein lerEdw1_014845, partial [Lerista edwardsae]